MQKRFFVLTLLVVALTLGLMPAVAQNQPIPLPVSADDVPTHIVVFNNSVGRADVPAVAQGLANAHGLQIANTYSHAVRGFAAFIPQGGGRLRALKNDPRVAYVEKNQLWQKAAQSLPTGINRVDADNNATIDIDGADDFRVDVDVAVLDTGIDSLHPDLNVVSHVDCAGGGPFSQNCKNGGSDSDGHGTHVAGTIAALDNGIGVVGVAPGARLHGVKVLGPNGGYTNWIIAGIDYVTANADVIEVVNMSLGCECSSQAQDDAMSASIAAGVVYVVAAGNSAKDASTFSPANHPDVVTVSALADSDGVPGGGAWVGTCRTDEEDTLANFSNYGSLVEVAAPGVCINSTLPGGGYGEYSGTSMASPHVAGAAALLASGANDPQNKADVDAIIATLISTGNTNWTDEVDGNEEPLINVSTFSPAMVATGGGGGDNGGGDGGGDTGGVAHVSDLDATVSTKGRNWSPNVTATIVDANGAAVANATVSGSWSTGGSTSCVTDGSGSCSQSINIKGGSSVTFTVSDVSASGYTYDAAANNDPDGDSNGTSITVNAP